MTRRLAAVLAAVALLAAACSSGAAAPQPSELNDKPTGSAYQGFGLIPPQPRPSFTLTDTSGTGYAFGRATAGKPTLLYFGYTHCPDVCPTTMADIGQALRQLPTDIQRRTQVVFVTTDV